MGTFLEFLESQSQEAIVALTNQLREQFPGLELFISERPDSVYVNDIRVPKELRGQGIGTKVIQAIKEYARSVSKPIVLTPQPEPRYKAKLIQFYRGLGFKPNKGRYKDYRLSNPFGPTMIWRPTWE